MKRYLNKKYQIFYVPIALLNNKQNKKNKKAKKTKNIKQKQISKAMTQGSWYNNGGVRQGR